MALIVAPDIFGNTPEFGEFVTDLGPSPDGVTVVDPHEGHWARFDDESKAYAFFRQTVGIVRYKERVLEKVNQAGAGSILIGFSIGASAVWAISGEVDPRKNFKAFCFYGSQIRKCPEIDPKMKIELFFPERESHFDVRELISRLCSKPNVQCHHTKYLHGFMNPRSENFDAAGYREFMQFIKARIA